MNLFDAKNKTKVNGQPQNPIVSNTMDLTAQEIELIMRILATAQFPIKDIEVLYLALTKLQEQFKVKTNTN
jgi:hypothetical protein